MPDQGKPKPPGALEVLAAGAGGVGGYALGGPGGAFLGAAAATYAAYGAGLARQILGDRTQRAERMLRSFISASGTTTQALEAKLGSSPRARFLTDEAIRAAEGTYWPESAQAIGRALADGVAEPDDAPVDLPAKMLAMMAELQESDVCLLNLITAHRYRRSHQPPYAASAEPIGPDEQRAEVRWAAETIAAVYPAAADLLPGILAHLAALGLIQEINHTGKLIAEYSRKTNQNANRINNRRGQRIQNYKTPEPITEMEASHLMPARAWSPTDLGRQLLGYYDLAAQQTTGNGEPGPAR